MWNLESTLIASDATPLDEFGNSVDVRGSRAVVGAHQHNGLVFGSEGRAYVFDYDGLNWSEAAILGTCEPMAGDELGLDVALDGDRVLTGAPHDDDQGGDAGTVLVFENPGSGWIETAKLLETPAISLSTGGALSFGMNPGPAFANQLYFLLGSLSGTSPGIGLPGGSLVPLNLDPYLSFTLSNPNTPPLANSFGFLNGAGQTINTPGFNLPPGLPPGLADQTVHHAFVVLDLFTGTPLAVSNPYPIQFVP